MRKVHPAPRNQAPVIEEHKRSLRSLLAAHHRGVDEAAELSRGSPERIEALRQLLADADPKVRRDAGWSLCYMMGRCREPLPADLIRTLGERLGDPNPDVSRASIHALSAYARSLEAAGVARKSIMELLKPAMPFVKRYGYDKSPAERDLVG